MFHLVCVHEFQHMNGKKYTRGMMITDKDEVNLLLSDREHHFVRIAAPAEEVADAPIDHE